MRRRFCRSISALAGLLAGALAVGCATGAQDEVAAVFKAHEVRFVYRSLVNPLDCGELRNHVAGILRAVGARDDIKVQVYNCDLFLSPEDDPEWNTGWDRASPLDRFGASPERMQISNVRIEVMFPVEATPAVLAEIDKDKSRRELISRVTGNPLAALNDPIIFPVQRKEVTLSRSTIRLMPRDCELLEQMIPTVFRKLDLKVVSRQLSCNPHQRTHFAPKLVVETLWPVGAPVPGEPPPRRKTKRMDRINGIDRIEECIPFDSQSCQSGQFSFCLSAQQRVSALRAFPVCRRAGRFLRR
jgi:hypothetical protein